MSKVRGIIVNMGVADSATLRPGEPAITETGRIVIGDPNGNQIELAKRVAGSAELPIPVFLGL